MASPSGESERLDPAKIDSATIEALYREHAPELRRFLTAVLRDESLASDAMQMAFVRALEVGHTTQEESRKSWLFRVAYHEALAIRRRQATGERILKQISVPDGIARAAETPLVTQEETERVRIALANLPRDQREVVHKRIYENKKFAEIAQELAIPLGTALTRMRTALATLRKALKD